MQRGGGGHDKIQQKQKHYQYNLLNFIFRVWEKFQLKNFGQYTDLYCITDTVRSELFYLSKSCFTFCFVLFQLLLQDVMENFRNMCLDIYGLDLVNFLTLPALR